MRIWILAVVLFVGAISTTADAATIYVSRAVFDAANPGLPVEDFESPLILPFDIPQVPAPLNSLSNNAFYALGEILPGISLTNIPPGGSELAASNQFFGENSTVVYSNLLLDTTEITFGPGVSAFGMDVYSQFVASTIDIQLFGPGGFLGAGSVLAPSAGGGAFFGADGFGLITRVTLSSRTEQAEGVDNVAFGASAIPEPSALLLLIVGGLMLRRRRKG